MSDIAIKVEGLSKSYLVGHNRSQAERYTALRDVIARNARDLARKTRDMLHGRAIVQGDEIEEFWALKDIDFEVQPGETLGIIGRNGAGKSTLLKILSRITEPTKGRITINGCVASLLEVGTGFHPELTGRENIYLNGAILGMSKVHIGRKLDEIVDFSGVEAFIDTPVKRYSSGMYVRLAFGVAAHLESDILIVDEVLAVGDAQFQKKCLSKMEDVSHREGRTVIIVSHQIPVINTLCSRCLWIDRGRIALDESPGTAIQGYLAGATSAIRSAISWENPEEAPGNEIVRLKSVRILQDGIDPLLTDFDIAREITVEIVFENLKEGSDIYAAFWLKDKVGVEILSTSNHKYISSTEDAWIGKPKPVGTYCSRCTFPANFFNEGIYRITPILGLTPSTGQILERDLISFNAIDLGDMRKEYLGGWLGVIRPKLPWSTEYLPPSTKL